jgi:hypothetical protein
MFPRRVGICFLQIDAHNHLASVVRLFVMIVLDNLIYSIMEVVVCNHLSSHVLPVSYLMRPHIVFTDGRQQRQPNHNTTTYCGHMKHDAKKHSYNYQFHVMLF